MKFFSYFSLMIAFVLGVGIVFYILTTEAPFFLGKEKGMETYRVLPRPETASTDFLSEEEKEPKEITPQILVPKASPKPKPAAPSPIEEQGPEPVQGHQIHVVSMEADGFKPRILIINAGDTVKWVNGDTALHWPASDPHPTHTGLTGFDPLADILPKESYSFRFNEAGVYGYHDHTQAVVAGVATLVAIVRVVEKQ